MLSQRVPFERKHEVDRVAFRKTDITAKCSADRRGSSISARTVSEFPTIRRAILLSSPSVISPARVFRPGGRALTPLFPGAGNVAHRDNPRST